MRPLYPVKKPLKLSSSGGFFMVETSSEVTFLGRTAPSRDKRHLETVVYGSDETAP
jgi:hypothetical protein